MGSYSIPLNHGWRRWVLSLERKDQLYKTHMNHGMVRISSKPEGTQQGAALMGKSGKVSFWNWGIILAGVEKNSNIKTVS